MAQSLTEMITVELAKSNAYVDATNVLVALATKAVENNNRVLASELMTAVNILLEKSSEIVAGMKDKVGE